jgi:DNA modification methylase
MMYLLASDAIDAVRSMGPERVDAVVTHPPYFMLGNVQVDTLAGLSPSRQGYLEYLRKFAVELLRVVKAEGYLCIAMGDSRRAASLHMGGMIDDVTDAIEGAGWPLIASIPWTNPSDDSVLVFGRGDARPELPAKMEGWLHKREGYDFFVWPRSVPATLIEACVPKGGCVLDPFMGSGATIQAAYLLDRDAVGIDVRPEYVKIAEQDLDELTKCETQTEATA